MNIVFLFVCPKRLMNDPSASLLPYGLLSMAAFLEREGHSVKVLHLARYGKKDALKMIVAMKPDIVGFSCFTFQRQRTIEWAEALAGQYAGLRPQERPLILFGGPHAAALAEKMMTELPWLDGVVRGEGERTIAGIAGRLCSGALLDDLPGLVARDASGRIIQARERPLIEDLDSLPSVAESKVQLLGVDRLYQMRHVMTSRGCSCNCVFCFAPRAWGGRVRSFGVDRVLREISVLKERHGLVYLSFRDDTFTCDRDWTIEFCRLLAQEHNDILWDCQSRVGALDAELVGHMARAGCIQIQLGLEAASPSVLRYLRKPFTVGQARETVECCRLAGISVSLYLICGTPVETMKDVRLTEEFVRACRPAGLSVSRLALYPGTNLAAAEQVQEERWFLDGNESIYLRTDRAALKAEKRLLTLAEETSRTESFSVDELKNVCTRLPGNPSSAYSLAALYERLERPDDALAVYEKILEEHPGWVWAELGIGEIYLDRGKFAAARQRLLRASSSVPLWPYPLDRLGWACLLMGRVDEGRELISRARGLDPYNEPPPPLSATDEQARLL